jgi:hypothetical protein
MILVIPPSRTSLHHKFSLNLFTQPSSMFHTVRCTYAINVPSQYSFLRPSRSVLFTALYSVLTPVKCTQCTVSSCNMHSNSRRVQPKLSTGTIKTDLHHAQLRHGRQVVRLRELLGPRASFRLPIRPRCYRIAYPLRIHTFTLAVQSTQQRTFYAILNGYHLILASIIDFRLYDCLQLFAILTRCISHLFTHICVAYNDLDIGTPHISC